MTNDELELESDVSIDVGTDGPIRATTWSSDEVGTVRVTAPRTIAVDEDWEPTIGFHVTSPEPSDLDEEPDDIVTVDGFGTCGFNLSRDDARELGEWLLEHCDDEPHVMFEEDDE